MYEYPITTLKRVLRQEADKQLRTAYRLDNLIDLLNNTPVTNSTVRSTEVITAVRKLQQHQHRNRQRVQTILQHLLQNQRR